MNLETDLLPTDGVEETRSISQPTLDDPRIHRRDFLLAGTGLGLAALLGACGDADGTADAVQKSRLATVAAQLPPGRQGYHVLKRTSFGVTAAALAEVESMGIQAYLERQLDFESIDDAAVKRAISQHFPTLDRPTATVMPGFPGNSSMLANDLFRASLFRAFFSPRQLYEVMVEFWSNHFSIHLGNGFGPALKPADDREVIRPRALGRFRDLLLASAHSPAMLFSLDNYLNTRAAPNENFARELMELHTLGVDGGYSEQDVKEVARCFTGWTVNFSNGAFEYQSAIHDTGAKRVLGQDIPAGGQQQDGIAVLHLLADAAATATHIATKLCRRFIADEPSAAVIATVAKRFRDSDGDLRATLRAIFSSADFLDARDRKFDRPVEFVGQILRALNPQLKVPDDGGAMFFSMVQMLGQLPFFWAPPDGYPDTAVYWASSSGFLNRWRVATFAVTAGGFDFPQLIGDANNVSSLIDRLSTTVLRRPLRPDDRQMLIRWIAGVAGGSADAPLPASALQSVAPLAAAMLISSIYFQLR